MQFKKQTPNLQQVKQQAYACKIIQGFYPPPRNVYTKIALISLFLMLLLIYACRKNDNSDANPNKAQLIIEAKSFFDDEIANLPQLNDNNVRHSLKKIPLWDKAKIKKISLGEAVIVPIKYEKDIFLKTENAEESVALQKTSYLMIYRDKLKNLKAEWVTLMPVKSEETDKFVGVVNIENWNGKFKRGFAFGAEGDILPIYLNSAITYKKIAYGKRDYCFTIEHYGYVMDYPQVIGTETFCFSDGGGGGNNNDQEQDVDDDDGTSGGGGGDTGPDDYTPDCDGVVGSGAYTNSTCNTCMGGTTGITECPPKRTVTDSTSHPCIKAGVALGITGNTTIGTMLNITFGASNEYGGLDLEFIEGNTGSDDGWCRKNGNISWVITINQNLPNVASKEYILSTVYHEILHAYLEATYPKDATGVFLIPHDEHQDMAEKYVILLTGALKINHPNLSDIDAWGLAWGGLHETPFYKDNTKLTEAQRIQIGEINRKHKNKNNQSDRSGSYCN